jgi:hypothetical protein
MKEQESLSLLSRLQISDIAFYLTGQGWRLVGQGATKAVYVLDSALPPGQVTLPLDPRLSNYRLAMAQLVQDLAESEGRTELDTIKRILWHDNDILRVQLGSSDLSNGSIPLMCGPELIIDARMMLQASALSTDEMRPSHGIGRSDRVRSYLKSTRMGQTEVGSYVLTLLSPVRPDLTSEDGQLSLGKEIDKPFERCVTENLMIALRATKDAVKSSALQSESKITPFLAAVKEGVSANLLEALADILSAIPVEEATFSVSWSSLRSVSENVPEALRFEKAEAPILRSAAEAMKKAEPQLEQTIEGKVIGLESDGLESPHTVTLKTKDDGKDRKLRFDLSLEDYLVAIKAHSQNLAVSCRGEIIREGNRSYLKNPRSFSLVEEPELDLE